MLNWMLMPFSKYATFAGRSQRSEYWYFALFVILFIFFIAIVEIVFGIEQKEDELTLLQSVFIFAIIVPSLSVGARRLHDVGKSGWWQLINIVPIVGPFILLYFLVQDSQPTENEYGPCPKSNG